MTAPPQPTAILRGHRTQVHAAAFVRVGSGSDDASSSLDGRLEDRLATGDADGFVVLWDLAIVRPRAVWRAHQNSILGLAGWRGDGGDCQVVTHGRDHKLVVWQLGAAGEARLSTALPLEDGTDSGSQQQQRPVPWMVHVLEVNTMNFCAFAWTVSAETQGETTIQRFVAVPNTLALEAVDIFQLPLQQRINTVKAGAKDGMLMALSLFYSSSTLVLIAAFENGAAVLATLDDGASGSATVRYRAQPHTQPILSLDVAPDQSYFLTSGADGIVAKHPISVGSPVTVAAAPAAPQKREPASADTAAVSPARPVSLLSAALAKEAAQSTTASTGARNPSRPPPPPLEPETQPLKIIDTKHAGQQGLRIRQDGRIFATAGWDGRARVYSAKTMKEVAVLKWHQTGCFAVAFAPLAGGSGYNSNTDETSVAKTTRGQGGGSREISVKERRLRHAATAHWLAVGSKDGKVSLWDIF
ncbi:WD repeat protein [Grosmannia clavigera kw1407]|uniref:ASTRA-associated protein 1 n=1 Tax=Grosmannia clavigera (strain kw1407 / UAMH 11150) TaxID=655863 RepID=F0XSZ1_GROCL|nr:WD repeat protein [Grosmannia clavigera kw1407]EFW99239.1 WD repeat protein [Grosmannia clavigera kw1407]